MTTTQVTACLMLIAAMGCGEPSDHEDAPFTELADRARAPAPHKPTPIEIKVLSLPDDIEAQYFDNAFEPGESVDSQGSPYKFYSGSLGLGAIYVVNGTAIGIKGPFLDEWGRAGYENASLMGYPRGDEVEGRQEFEPQWVGPEVENNGLSERRHYLVYEDGAIHHVFENWYLDSNLPYGQLSRQPQPCRVSVVTPIEGSALEALLDDPKYGGYIPSLYCGAERPPWVPPQNAERDDI